MRAARTGAPHMPVSPPITASEPNVPLFVALSRGGMAAPKSAGALSTIEGVALASISSVETKSRPVRSRPCDVKCPGFAPMNVMVSVARTASPPFTGAPVSLFRPLGTSSASTRPEARARRVMRAAISANTPSSGRVRPMPNMPSTSQPKPSNEAGGWLVDRHACRARRFERPARIVGLDFDGHAHAHAQSPARCSRSAITSASPPLFPGPATSHTGRARESRIDAPSRR